MMLAKEENSLQTGRIAYRSEQLRYLSILVRSFHQIAVALYLGAVVFASQSPVLQHVLIAVVSTGLLLLSLEGVRHRQFYRETFGLMTFFKTGLVGLAYHKFIPELPMLLVVFLLASLVSHAPKKFRHRLLFSSRVAG